MSYELVSFVLSSLNVNIVCLSGEFTELFSTTWSQGGRPRSVKYLADILKNIIRAEKKMNIPTKPPTKLPKRRETPIVGTLTTEAKEIDRKYFSNVATLREDAQEMIRHQNARGECSMYSLMQDDVKPDMSELVKDNERIDVLCGVVIRVGSVNQEVLGWCQGKVKHEIKGREYPTVMVKWDKMSDIKGWEKGGDKE